MEMKLVRQIMVSLLRVALRLQLTGAQGGLGVVAIISAVIWAFAVRVMDFSTPTVVLVVQV